MMNEVRGQHTGWADADEPGSDDAWLRFLLEEGLDLLAAFRSIKDPAVRAMFIRLVKEAAQAGRNADLEIH